MTQTTEFNTTQELLKQENQKLKEWIASDSVYQALRLVYKYPTDFLDAEDQHNIDLYRLSCELRKNKNEGASSL